MPFSFPASPTVGQTSTQNGRTYVWTGVWELASNVAGHAAQHATGGSDAITAASIGAAATSHTHTASAVTDFATEAAKHGPVTTVAGRTGAISISSADVSGLGSLATASSVAYADLTGTPTTFTPSSHVHAASDISSGTLDAARLPASAVLTTDGRLTMSLARFTARDNHPPASNFATLDTRNSILVLEFDAATEESATFLGVVNENASLTNGLTVRLWWMGDTATSGNVRWGAQFEKTGTDTDADSYDTNAQATSAANATSGIESIASITITTIDSLAAGDRFRLSVYRVAADATNDTMTGDAQLVAVEVRAA